jgi:hypothetical protein
MALGGIWSRITGGIVALGVGAAARDAIDPVLEVEKQQAWGRRAVRVLHPTEAAQAAARGIDHGVNYSDDAKRGGVGLNRYRTLLDMARDYPGLSEALELWRRDPNLKDDFHTWMRRQGFSDEVANRLAVLKEDRLAPSDVANAVQQGFMPDAGLLPGDVKGPPFAVPVEQVNIPTLAEFEDHGIDGNRAKVLAELAGLPPAPVELAQMVLRDQISETTFFHGVREGHTKTKWGSALLYYLTHPLLNPGVEIRRLLKGWQSKAVTDTRMAQYGYTPEQVQDWYEAEGRPAAPGQMATAVARGVDGPDGVPMDRAQFLKGIRESDIRPEWGPMLWAIRFAYPPLFQINRLVQGGAIDAATAVEWAKKDRYAPEVIAALDKYWSGGAAPGAATLGPRVKAAQTTAITEIRNAYLIGQADEAQARDWLNRIGVEADEIDGMIPVWNVMREVPQKGLTAAQIKKAAKSLPAQWPRARALDELQLLGLTADDAATLLDE